MSSPTRRSQRLFLGFSLSAAQSAELAGWQQQYLNNTKTQGHQGALVTPSNLHLTLAFFGNVAAEQLLALHESIEALPLERFAQPLGQLAYWPQPKICCLTNGAVAPALQYMAAAAQKLAGSLQLHQSEHEVYRPHITLARKLAAAEAELALSQTAPQLMLAPHELHLYESNNDGSGVRYDIVSSWPLEE